MSRKGSACNANTARAAACQPSPARNQRPAVLPCPGIQRLYKAGHSNTHTCRCSASTASRPASASALPRLLARAACRQGTVDEGEWVCRQGRRGRAVGRRVNRHARHTALPLHAAQPSFHPRPPSPLARLQRLPETRIELPLAAQQARHKEVKQGPQLCSASQGGRGGVRTAHRATRCSRSTHCTVAAGRQRHRMGMRLPSSPTSPHTCHIVLHRGARQQQAVPRRQARPLGCLRHLAGGVAYGVAFVQHAVSPGLARHPLNVCGGWSWKWVQHGRTQKVLPLNQHVKHPGVSRARPHQLLPPPPTHLPSGSHSS